MENMDKLENKKVSEKLSERQLKEDDIRKVKIKRMRASVVRSQIIKIYADVENIRFDHINDTAFRDYFTRVKKNLESALGDYLVDDDYWKEQLSKLNK